MPIQDLFGVIEGPNRRRRSVRVTGSPGDSSSVRQFLQGQLGDEERIIAVSNPEFLSQNIQGFDPNAAESLAFQAATPFAGQGGNVPPGAGAGVQPNAPPAAESPFGGLAENLPFTGGPINPQTLPFTGGDLDIQLLSGGLPPGIGSPTGQVGGRRGRRTPPGAGFGNIGGGGEIEPGTGARATPQPSGPTGTPNANPPGPLGSPEWVEWAQGQLELQRQGQGRAGLVPDQQAAGQQGVSGPPGAGFGNIGGFGETDEGTTGAAGFRPEYSRAGTLQPEQLQEQMEEFRSELDTAREQAQQAALDAEIQSALEDYYNRAEQGAVQGQPVEFPSELLQALPATIQVGTDENGNPQLVPNPIREQIVQIYANQVQNAFEMQRQQSVNEVNMLLAQLQNQGQLDVAREQAQADRDIAELEAQTGLSIAELNNASEEEIARLTGASQEEVARIQAQAQALAARSGLDPEQFISLQENVARGGLTPGQRLAEIEAQNRPETFAALLSLLSNPSALGALSQFAGGGGSTPFDQPVPTLSNLRNTSQGGLQFLEGLFAAQGIPPDMLRRLVGSVTPGQGAGGSVLV